MFEQVFIENVNMKNTDMRVVPNYYSSLIDIINNWILQNVFQFKADGGSYSIMAFDNFIQWTDVKLLNSGVLPNVLLFSDVQHIPCEPIRQKLNGH